MVKEAQALEQLANQTLLQTKQLSLSKKKIKADLFPTQLKRPTTEKTNPNITTVTTLRTTATTQTTKTTIQTTKLTTPTTKRAMILRPTTKPTRNASRVEGYARVQGKLTRNESKNVSPTKSSKTTTKVAWPLCFVLQR